MNARVQSAALSPSFAPSPSFALSPLSLSLPLSMRSPCAPLRIRSPELELPLSRGSILVTRNSAVDIEGGE